MDRRIRNRGAAHCPRVSLRLRLTFFRHRKSFDCMSLVQLNEIIFGYSKTPILRKFCLDIREGEYLVLLGASGCGKTSVLRLIAGLIRPESGSISIGGRDVVSVKPRERDVSLVPQGDGLYPHLPIGKSIALGIKRGLNASSRETRIAEAAAAVGIGNLLDRLPEQLSGGEKKRAALAKAAVSGASVRLLDEPLSAIDAAMRFQIERDLKQLHQNYPGATLHVTHDGAEARRLGDRIAVIEDGRVAQVGDSKSVFQNPASVSVAAAMGTSPFVTTRIIRRSDQWVDNSGRALPGPLAANGTEATLGYYLDDCSGDNDVEYWIDPQLGHRVASDKLRWFVDQPPAR